MINGNHLYLWDQVCVTAVDTEFKPRVHSQQCDLAGLPQSRGNERHEGPQTPGAAGATAVLKDINSSCCWLEL